MIHDSSTAKVKSIVAHCCWLSSIEVQASGAVSCGNSLQRALKYLLLFISEIAIQIYLCKEQGQVLIILPLYLF